MLTNESRSIGMDFKDTKHIVQIHQQYVDASKLRLLIVKQFFSLIFIIIYFVIYVLCTCMLHA